MAKMFICDRCAKTYDKEYEGRWVTFSLKAGGTLDLCDKCYSEFEDFLGKLVSFAPEDIFLDAPEDDFSEIYS